MRRRFLSRWDFAVLDTEHKGKGLFAQHDIPEGAYLFDYEGETLDLPAYESRYPDKVSDYAVGIKMPNGAMQFKDAADPRKSGLALSLRKQSFRGPLGSLLRNMVAS